MTAPTLWPQPWIAALKLGAIMIEIVFAMVIIGCSIGAGVRIAAWRASRAPHNGPEAGN